MERNERLIGESSAMLEVQERVSMVAALNKPVLIIGERGTGKEMIAARVHYLSERWGQEYLKLNCAAISDSLLDSELFGHEQGSFSGASRQHKGVFERADGGTLFLDELATTSMQVQEKILRVIEYGELTRLGSDKTIEVDVRLVAATNGDLPKLAEQGKFRADLLDRLAFDVITLPPLRERPEDIPILAEFFALGMTKELGRSYFPGFSKKALRTLCAFGWPGNVRELKNVVERAVYRSRDEDNLIDDIIFDPFDSPYRPRAQQAKVSDTSAVEIVDPWQLYQRAEKDFKQYVEDLEIEVLKAALVHSQHNQKKTAEALGLTYHQLRAYLRKYQITN